MSIRAQLSAVQEDCYEGESLTIFSTMAGLTEILM